jgi:hypothetical protein
MGYQQFDLTSVITNTPVLQSLLCKAEQLVKLNRLVLQKLDPSLRNHCQVTNLKNGILTLSTPSSAFGHQLRFQEMDILSLLRSNPEFCGLKSIHIQVRPNPITEPPSVTEIFPRPTLSLQSASVIIDAAERASSPSLRKALLKLSKRAK